MKLTVYDFNVPPGDPPEMEELLVTLIQFPMEADYVLATLIDDTNRSFQLANHQFMVESEE